MEALVVSSIKLSPFKGIEIVSNGNLPDPLVYALAILLIAVAIRILFGLPFTPFLRGVSRALKHLQNRANWKL
jgi:hypothetical protein